MAITRKGIVGLDLGHHRLKAVQIDRTSSGWKVTRSGSIPTPPECLKDGVAVDGMVLSAALKQLLKEARITATAAHIAAAGGSVFVRPVQFPKMNEATLRKSIRFEAGRYVPGSVEESFIEFEILGDAGGGQMNVLIVAAPKDVVESRVAACEAAGLDVELVDVESFAIYRSLMETRAEGAPASSFALVDIGAASTSVSIVHDGIFAMNRSIPHGGRVLTEALMSYFKLTEEDAEAGKTQLNVTELLTELGVLESPPLKVIQPHIDDLVREIRRSLNYFQSQQTETQEGRKVEHLVICGGGAKLPGLAEYLSHRLGMPVTARGVFDNPQVLAYETEEGDSGLDYAIACGLALCNQIKGAHPKAAPQEAAPKKVKEKAPKKAKSWRKAPKKGKNEPVAETVEVAQEEAPVELELISSLPEVTADAIEETPPIVSEAPEPEAELEIAPPPPLTSEVEELVAQIDAPPVLAEEPAPQPEEVPETEDLPPLTTEAQELLALIAARSELIESQQTPKVAERAPAPEPENLLGADAIANLLSQPEPHPDFVPESTPPPAPLVMAEASEPENLLGADAIANLLAQPEPRLDDVPEATVSPAPIAEIVAPPVIAEDPEPIEELQVASPPPLTSETEDLIEMISAASVEKERVPLPEPENLLGADAIANLLAQPEPHPDFVPESHVPPEPVMNEIEALLAQVAEPTSKKAKAQEPTPVEPEIIAEAPAPPVEPEAEAVAEPEAEAPTGDATTTKKRGRSRKAA